MTQINSIEALRKIYKQPAELVIRKELPALDKHCRLFIEKSPFAVVATSGADGRHDASPRGGTPGFTHILDERTLLIPDRPGNNRLDTLTNIIETGRIALIFFVPGINEELRVNGRAHLSSDLSLREKCAEKGKVPTVVIVVALEEAYLHCAKALMRAELWSAEAQVDRRSFPSIGQMLKDQLSLAEDPEPVADMEARYKEKLY